MILNYGYAHTMQENPRNQFPLSLASTCSTINRVKSTKLITSCLYRRLSENYCTILGLITDHIINKNKHWRKRCNPTYIIHIANGWVIIMLNKPIIQKPIWYNNPAQKPLPMSKRISMLCYKCVKAYNRNTKWLMLKKKQMNDHINFYKVRSDKYLSELNGVSFSLLIYESLCLFDCANLMLETLPRL